MAFSSNVKFYTAFSDVSLVDQVSSEQLLSVGQSSLLADGSGWDMNRNSYAYLSPANLGLSSDFTLGFWLYPKFPGLAASGNSTTEMRLSVMDYGTGTVTDSSVAISSPVLRITEEVSSLSEHSLVITFGDIDYQARTSTYAPNKWHCFHIAYDGSSLTVYIDGKSSTLTVLQGALPASISGASGIFSFNRLSFSPASDMMNNDGYLSNVYVLNTSETDSQDIKRIINHGFISYADTVYSNINYIDWLSYIDDPTSIRTNGVFNLGSTVLAARSDGRIMQGSPVFWTSRRQYSDSKEQEVLKVSDDVTIEDGLLKITKGTVSF